MTSIQLDKDQMLCDGCSLVISEHDGTHTVTKDGGTLCPSCVRKAEWTEAMDWCRSSDSAHLIRSVAVSRLEEGWPEGQGIGSSDTNHAVYSLYQDYKEVKDNYPTVILFLVDYWNGLV